MSSAPIPDDSCRDFLPHIDKDRPASRRVPPELLLGIFSYTVDPDGLASSVWKTPALALPRVLLQIPLRSVVLPALTELEITETLDKITFIFPFLSFPRHTKLRLHVASHFWSPGPKVVHPLLRSLASHFTPNDEQGNAFHLVRVHIDALSSQHSQNLIRLSASTLTDDPDDSQVILSTAHAPPSRVLGRFDLALTHFASFDSPRCAQALINSIPVIHNARELHISITSAEESSSAFMDLLEEGNIFEPFEHARAVRVHNGTTLNLLATASIEFDRERHARLLPSLQELRLDSVTFVPEVCGATSMSMPSASWELFLDAVCRRAKNGSLNVVEIDQDSCTGLDSEKLSKLQQWVDVRCPRKV
ncbi:hypothetical protein K488DRAFT_88296 [Vararia minispora EC-137]|uniref:Uncharacterized protein n=1 Tax=Vararia minispora EC-137 TaxID=1314806 RepID=A0ACB8QDQ4_9AGAM|nr:hypothetical protein K488DRAFT_88296 [Vararia minispora EC-137]